MISKLDAIRLDRRHFTAASMATAAILATGKSLAAQEGTPEGSAAADASADVQVETLATGLAAPRFLAIGDDGVYFTESGSGGDTAVFQNVGEGTPAPEAPVSGTGYTGKLSRLEADDTVTVIVDDFRSYTFGANGEIVGPAGVSLDGSGKAYVAVGAPGPFIAQIDLTGEESVVYEVDLASGEKKVIANLGEYEITNNPDPAAIDSNLYGAQYTDGILYVADAGGNDIISVDVATGDLSTFTVTGGLDAPFMKDGNPLRGGAAEIDSVPSCVVLGPDGRLYVSFVSGAPFPAGIVPVNAYALDGTEETFATGLTMVGDLAFSSDGTLYACIISADLINQKPGMVVRVSPDGNHTIVIDNLIVPNGIAFDADDNLYLLNKVTGVPGGGELLRFTGVATAVGQPLPKPEGAPAGSPVAGAAEPVHMALEDIRFNPNELTIPANTDVPFTFENRGVLSHDFAIDDPKVFSGVLAGGQSANLVLNLPAGKYEFYCSQVGHRAAGMVGTLTVE